MKDSEKEKIKHIITKGVRVASEVAGIAVLAQKNLGPIGTFSIAARGLNTLLNLSQKEPVKGWSHLDIPLGDFILGLVKTKSLTDSFPGKDSWSPNIVTMTLSGVRFRWEDHEKWKRGPFLDPSVPIEVGTSILRSFLWGTMGTRVRFEKTLSGEEFLKKDLFGENIHSEKADQIWNHEFQFLCKGKSRSLLLAGEPGTGKSTIVGILAEKAGGLRLRISAKDLSFLGTLNSLISFLQPSAVIIDDLDRAEKPYQILDTLDSIMISSPLTLVTINQFDKLDAAAIRRFSEVYSIESLGDDVISSLLKGVDPKISERLKNLPVKYIHDYKEAIDVLGHEKASEIVDRIIEKYEIVSKVGNKK